MSASLSHAARMLNHGEQVTLIRDWNEAHPIGTDVIFRRDVGEPLETKTCSRAQLLNGHTAVIWLDGVSGCVALDRVSARGK